MVMLSLDKHRNPEAQLLDPNICMSHLKHECYKSSAIKKKQTHHARFYGLSMLQLCVYKVNYSFSVCISLLSALLIFQALCVCLCNSRIVESLTEVFGAVCQSDSLNKPQTS